MSQVKQFYLLVDKIAEAKHGPQAAVLGEYDTRAEARQQYNSFGGALNGYAIIQVTTIAIEKQIR